MNNSASMLKAAAFSVLLIFAGTGCSRHHVVHQETTETVSSSSDPSETGGTDYKRTQMESSEVEREDSSPSCDGVLSCAVHAVGEVLAFPFRAVGYVFQALF